MLSIDYLVLVSIRIRIMRHRLSSHLSTSFGLPHKPIYSRNIFIKRSMSPRWSTICCILCVTKIGRWMSMLVTITNQYVHSQASALLFVVIEFVVSWLFCVKTISIRVICMKLESNFSLNIMCRLIINLLNPTNGLRINIEHITRCYVSIHS